MRIHILSCSARKQRAEECQILQPGIKYPCCALWGSCPCTHSLLDTLGHIWSQPGQQAHQLPQEAFWPAPLSRNMASFSSRHIFCEPGPATHFTPALALLLMDVLLPRTHSQSHSACTASASPLKLHLPRGEHSPAGRFCSP